MEIYKYHCLYICNTRNVLRNNQNKNKTAAIHESLYINLFDFFFNVMLEYLFGELLLCCSFSGYIQRSFCYVTLFAFNLTSPSKHKITQQFTRDL